MLLTAAVVVPSMSDTSAARNASTSRRTSTARCCGVRYCRLAISASRRLSRAVTMAAGSAESGITSASGTGWSQLTSDPPRSGNASGSDSGPHRPDGSMRRLCLASSVRQALVAIWYSQVRTEDRPSKPS